MTDPHLLLSWPVLRAAQAGRAAGLAASCFPAEPNLDPDVAAERQRQTARERAARHLREHWPAEYAAYVGAYLESVEQSV